MSEARARRLERRRVLMSAGWRFNATRAHLAEYVGAHLVPLCRGSGGTHGNLYRFDPEADMVRGYLVDVIRCRFCRQSKVYKHLAVVAALDKIARSS